MGKQIAINTDCMEYMRTLPDKAFDLAVVDPPYFSGPERRGYYGNKVSAIGVHRAYPISPKWDVPGTGYFSQLVRVAKKYIVWGCNYFGVVFPPGRIVWDKCNDNSSFSDCEIAATNCHDSVRIKAIPAADVAPVVHGRWEWADDGYCRCSECRQRAPVVYGALIEDYQDEPQTVMTYFCPHCGAMMDGGDSDVAD